MAYTYDDSITKSAPMYDLGQMRDVLIMAKAGDRSMIRKWQRFEDTDPATARVVWADCEQAEKASAKEARRLEKSFRKQKYKGSKKERQRSNAWLPVLEKSAKAPGPLSMAQQRAVWERELIQDALQSEHPTERECARTVYGHPGYYVSPHRPEVPEQVVERTPAYGSSERARLDVERHRLELLKGAVADIVKAHS